MQFTNYVKRFIIIIVIASTESKAEKNTIWWPADKVYPGDVENALKFLKGRGEWRRRKRRLDAGNRQLAT